jgi:hypothetical protein
MPIEKVRGSDKPPLNKFSDEELRSELKRRAAERRERAVRERADRNGLVVKHIDGILSLFEHSKTTCGDDNFNAYAGCNRCTALSIKQAQHMDSDYVLHISFDRDPLPDPDEL